MTELCSFPIRFVGWVIYLGCVAILMSVFWKSNSHLRSAIPLVLVGCSSVLILCFGTLYQVFCLLDCFGDHGLVEIEVQVLESGVTVEEHITLFVL